MGEQHRLVVEPVILARHVDLLLEAALRAAGLPTDTAAGTDEEE